MMGQGTTTARGSERSCLACGGVLASQPSLVGSDLMHGVPGRFEIFACERCGSGTTLPLAGPQEIAAYYRDDYAPYGLPRGVLAAVMSAVQRARDRGFPLAELRAAGSGTLLDIGCGRGDLAASWIDAGWEAVGVEPSPEAAATAQSRGVRVSVGTLDTVALEPESVDAAVFRHSLEHVPDPAADLRRVYDALRPGGRVAVIVPNWDSWQRRAFASSWFPLELPRHRTHFSAAGLRAALEGAGFVAVETRPGTPFITTTWSVQFRLFGRCLTTHGPALLAGYGASLVIAPVVRVIDLLRGSGDFLHALGEKPA